MLVCGALLFLSSLYFLLCFRVRAGYGNVWSVNSQLDWFEWGGEGWSAACCSIITTHMQTGAERDRKGTQLSFCLTSTSQAQVEQVEPFSLPLQSITSINMLITRGVRKYL